MRTKNQKSSKASNAPSFLVGRMPLIMLMLSAALVSSLTSCQSGPYLYQPQRPTVVPIFYERPPSKAVTQSVRKVATSRSSPVATKSNSQRSKKPTIRLPQNQSKRIQVPVPVYEEYSARWDMRKVSDSKDGVYWVVDRRNRTWRMKPTEFWPFWAKHIYLGGRLKMYDPYNP